MGRRRSRKRSDDFVAGPMAKEHLRYPSPAYGQPGMRWTRRGPMLFLHTTNVVPSAAHLFCQTRSGVCCRRDWPWQSFTLLLIVGPTVPPFVEDFGTGCYPTRRSSPGVWRRGSPWRRTRQRPELRAVTLSCGGAGPVAVPYAGADGSGGAPGDPAHPYLEPASAGGYAIDLEAG